MVEARLLINVTGLCIITANDDRAERYRVDSSEMMRVRGVS